jgi:hypothetical protein
MVDIQALVSHAISLSFTAASLKMAEYDLDFGSKNDYETAQLGDGGQGQFGAVSPSNWRVPGTSPVGQASYSGAADGGDEPWFAEAVSTVSLDLAKAEETLMAFTKEAATFKMDAFAGTSPTGFTNNDAAMADLIGVMGYSKFLESSPKQLNTAWDKLKGNVDPPKAPPAEKKE